MASKDRRSSTDLKWDLLQDTHPFSFYQVMRLLPFFTETSDKNDVTKKPPDPRIRIRPKLSLAFPPSDIDKIVETDGEEPGFLVTANLLGLYGAASPLPTFYTEDLMDEAGSDKSISREFVDIFNHRIYILLFQAWSKYRQTIQVVEEKNTDHFVRLFSLLGIGERPLRDDIPDAPSLLRYVGLFTQSPRSAMGLKTLLQDAFGEIPVQVIPCIHRMARIPEDQRLFLGKTGCALGSDSFIGQEIEDRMGKFRLRLGPLNGKVFQSLLPGTEASEKLAFLTSFYVVDSLEYDVELVLAEREAQPACLGAPEWSMLGLDTWVFAKDQIGEVSARFSPGETI